MSTLICNFNHRNCNIWKKLPPKQVMGNSHRLSGKCIYWLREWLSFPIGGFISEDISTRHVLTAASTLPWPMQRCRPARTTGSTRSTGSTGATGAARRTRAARLARPSRGYRRHRRARPARVCRGNGCYRRNGGNRPHWRHRGNQGLPDRRVQPPVD